jgi:glycosyltransferase involved in cell wall biosynthesis
MYPLPYTSFLSVCKAGSPPNQHLQTDRPHRVLFVAGDTSQCGYYRAYLPALSLQRHSEKFHAVVTHHLSIDLIDWADIIVWQRLCDPKLFPFFARARRAAKISIYELDDNWHTIDDANPARAKADAAVFSLGGLEISNVYETALLFMSACDHVLVATETLASFYRKYVARPIHVINNSIDLARGDLSHLRGSFPKIRIIWAGGSSHARDLAIVAPALRRLKQSLDGRIKIILIGFDGVATIKMPDGTSKLFDAAVPYDACEAGVFLDEFHPYLARRTPDIGIAPLADIEFNDFKSPVKFHDYAYAGAPTIASNSVVYRQVMSDGHNGLLVENTTDAWHDALLRLCTDDALRRNLAARAIATTRNYATDNVYLQYEMLFNHALAIGAAKLDPSIFVNMPQ